MQYIQKTLLTQGRVNNMELSIGDIMGEDHIIYSKLENNGEITILIYGEEGNLAYKETSHHYAWDSLVYFAKQVIEEDEKIKMQGGLQ